VLERLLYEKQIEQLSDEELAMIEEFSNRLKQIKEAEHKGPEELEI
jgi:hypothetical protein